MNGEDVVILEEIAPIGYMNELVSILTFIYYSSFEALIFLDNSMIPPIFSPILEIFLKLLFIIKTSSAPYFILITLLSDIIISFISKLSTIRFPLLNSISPVYIEYPSE
jgi:hypothetical protein